MMAASTQMKPVTSWYNYITYIALISPPDRDVKRQTLLLRAQRPGDALYGTGQLEVRVTGQ